MFKRLLALLSIPALIWAQAPQVAVTTRASKTVALTIAEADKNMTDLQHAVNAAPRSWGAKDTTTSGLVLGYYGGLGWTGSAWSTVADGTVTLTANATNYVERTLAGTVSANTTGWTANLLHVGIAITGPSTITTWTDYRNAPVTYAASGSGALEQAVSSKLARTVDVMDFGAIGDGSSHALSSVTSFAGTNTTGWTLGQWQTVFSFATSLTNELDYCATQQAINSDKGGTIILPQGHTFVLSGVLLDGSTYNGTTLRIEGTVLLQPSGGGNNFQSACWGGIILHSVDSVTIDCPGILNGNRANQPNSVYEHTLVIAGATNTRIPRMNIAEIRGDGIYVGLATLGSASANSTNLTIGNLSGINSADDGRNLLTVTSCAGVSIGSVYSYQIGGTVNSTRQPGGIDFEPGLAAEVISDVTIGSANITTVGTSGLQVSGKSISGVDANMDWNISRVTIRSFNVYNTALAAASGAPNFARCTGLLIAGQLNRPNAGNGINLDFLNRVTAELDISGASTGLIVAVAGYVYDFNIKVNIPNYTAAGIQVTGAARGRFSGRIYGATNGSTTRAIYTTTNARTLSPSQPNVIYAIDAPFDGNNTNAFRNDHTNTVTFGTGTRIENCDYTGYATNTLQVDTFAQIPSVNVQGRNYATAMPSTGIWVQGDFVQKSNFALGDSQGKAILGWERITTGTSNTLNTDWVAAYTTVGSAANATVAASPSDPATTTSATQVMMGLGVGNTITPATTGRVTFTISGQIANATVNDGVQVQLYTGTGTAPANATAVGSAGTTRTARGNIQTQTSLVAGASSGFSVSFTVTGLTVGTPYWFDIALNAVTGGTASAKGCTISAVEN